MATLSILIDGVPQKFPVENATVTLGRGLESDIRLKDIKASRRHCQIVKTPKGYQCLDLSSGNGTYVNGVQIKAQMLAPGDKITIGSTTISFEDNPPPAKATASRPASGAAPALKPSVPAPKAPAPPPRPAPVEAAPAPVSSKTATAKIPTAKVQAVPARKNTAKVEALKSASGPVRAATAQMAKSGPRPSLKQSTSRGTRAARPAAEPAPRKSRALLIVALLVVVGGLGAGGWFFFGPKDTSDQVRKSVDAILKKAEEAKDKDQIEAAIVEYKNALELCQGDRMKVKAADIRAQIQQLEARRTASGTPPSSRQDPKDPPDKGRDFASQQKEINGKFKLGADPSGADWAGALREWKDVLARKPTADAEAKIQAEIRSINERAGKEFDQLRKKADALAQENKMAEAVDLLKKQQPRFEGTEHAAAFELAMKQYDK